MKINVNYMVLMAVLCLGGLAMVGCDDDDDSSSPDANVSDGSVDSNFTDVLVKLDGKAADGGADTSKDGAIGDASSDVGGGDAGGDAAPGATGCSNYCDAIIANCIAANAQYTNKGDCMSACQNKLAWPAGSEGAGNTLSCRIKHAGLAAGSPTNATTHCPHAGPTGAGVCGTLCENYCYLASKNCTGNNVLYATDAACMTACAGIGGEGGFATTGAFGDTTGNTLQCRVYHVNIARDNANVHCPHSGVAPTAFCVPAP